MPAIVPNNGLHRIGVQPSQATSGSGPTYSASRHIQTLSVDDSSTTPTSGTTTLGSPSNEFDVVFDATPTRSALVVTHIATVPAVSGNFTIRRIALHDDTAANVTGSSATVVAMIYGQSLTKDSSFSITFTITLTYADAS